MISSGLHSAALVAVCLLLLNACEKIRKPARAETPSRQQQTTALDNIRIHPSVDVLPANHLKFYIEFPQAMARGDIFQYFSLIENESGNAVPDPFREIELWNENARRLTLWFHPGRQKPGVNLNIDIGPILEEGKNYTLILSGKWQRETGQILGKDVKKSFRAGPVDNTQPDPQKWQYSIPAAGSSTALSITFPAPLDYALIPRTIQISSNHNSKIGSSHDGQSIQFIPASPWKAGQIKITISPILEDLAGNSIARPFNLDLQTTPELPKPSKTMRSFTIK